MLRSWSMAGGKITPRWPAATARLISLTAAATEDVGTIHCGTKRELAAAHSSISQSLYARTQSRSSSFSPITANVSPPTPATDGYNTERSTAPASIDQPVIQTVDVALDVRDSIVPALPGEPVDPYPRMLDDVIVGAYDSGRRLHTNFQHERVASRSGGKMRNCPALM